jgi:hypothetical protein
MVDRPGGDETQSRFQPCRGLRCDATGVADVSGGEQRLRRRRNFAQPLIFARCAQVSHPVHLG